MNAAGSVYDASSAPPPISPAVVSGGSQGAISGRVLRPGSIDQSAFVQMLQQAQQNREAAGVGGRPVAMPVPSFQSNIPTLSSAQFAALVGDRSDGAGDGDSADPQSVAQDVARAAAPTAAAQTTGSPVATALKLTGRPIQSAAAQERTGGTTGTSTVSEDAPIFTQVAQGTSLASAETSPATATDAAASDAVAAAGQATADPGTAAAGTKADASKPLPPPDPNVVHLKDAPDRETQRNLMAQHKRWIVDETPGSRQLFFGPDGKFGWDDFLDVINPLQHIPIVAQIYRAVTGDQIYGAADLIGALPLGPLGMVGMMGTIADLAVKDTTGKDIGDNLEAMVFGPSKDKTGTDGTAADTSDMAEATPVHPDLGMQTASAEPVLGNMDAEREAHDQRKA
jgi:hypothetical protein